MGIALITGASAGLGVEFAKLFAQDGHSLVLVARRLDRLNQVASELKKKHAGINIWVLEENLGLPNAGQSLYSKIKNLNIQIDYLVNNAGFGSNGPFKNLPLAKELQMIDLNIRTLTELTHLFLPAMIERKKGHILNIGSTAGFQPGPYMAVYYATKAFVNSFSEGLYEELKGTGVSCTVLTPGATATEFASSANAEKNILFRLLPVATSRDVAICGYKGMLANHPLVVSGALNRISLFFLRFLPRCMVRSIAGRVNR